MTDVLAWRGCWRCRTAGGDVNGLLVATVVGALGLALLGDWLRRHELGR